MGTRAETAKIPSMPPHPHIPIWSEEFLAEELAQTPEYQKLLPGSPEFSAFLNAVRTACADMMSVKGPNETITIERAIRPVLTALGWPNPIEKAHITSRDEADLVLYASETEREAALTLPEPGRVKRAVGLVECKQWGRDFDARNTGGRAGESGAEQVRRYLVNAGTDSEGGLAWAIITNGSRWRLYSYNARPRERYVEFDLGSLLATATQGALFIELDETALHSLRVAFLLLRRDSWASVQGEIQPFLQSLLAEGRRSEERVASDLSEVIFNNVFPDLVRAFWRKAPEASPQFVSQSALTFLYRLQFIYYSEDRGLLPVSEPGYQPHSLRYALRDAIAKQRGRSAAFSTVSTSLWDHISTLRHMINLGDPSIGIPAYNGGLFTQKATNLADNVTLSDAELADVIHPLSHSNGRYISYASLSIQQLGSIYERLLERQPVRTPDGKVEITIHPYARKDSGSYYTPQELVDLIVEQTLRPLVEERKQTFRSDPRPENDPAQAVLALKVLDPAMGSGRFLITALDWLTDRAMELMDWAARYEQGYVSPLRRELDERRVELSERGLEASDRDLVQRMVLRRCIYGVDKNQMAVQLALVALWLRTFIPGFPLAYIEYRICTGDALIGTWAQDAAEYIHRWAPRLKKGFMKSWFNGYRRGLLRLWKFRQRYPDLPPPEDQEITDADIEIVDAKYPRCAFTLNFTTGLRWLSTGLNKTQQEELHEPMNLALMGALKRAADMLNETNFATPGIETHDDISKRDYYALERRARATVETEFPLNWEFIFPDVFPPKIKSDEPPPESGFDAIIGNPPWDRIRLEEVEWLDAREHPLARTRTAAERKRGIAQLRKEGDPVAEDFDATLKRAAELATHIRKCGEYPLMGRGDINIYSLFVERAARLVKPNGIIGLLTPSGVYSDRSAAAFFKSISSTGRLSGIYDFQNSRSVDPDDDLQKWFPDVHPQFKFCAIVYGGAERRFAETRCGFFLDGTQDLEDDDRVFALTSEDFARINPNTGTAPILRSGRDAEIVKGVYALHPTLSDRSPGEGRRIWPVRYHTMFHMTNDSGLFRTKEQLEAEGAYRTAPDRYSRGEESWLPLYQGRTIHHFDHRANGVEFNPESLRNPYRSKPVTDLQHANPRFAPGVQYWVPAAEVETDFPEELGWAIGFRNITNATNERTMIATVVPRAGYGNSLPLLLPDPEFPAAGAACLVANFASIPFDFIVRCKLSGTNMNWFIVEQLPVIAPAGYDVRIGDTTARELVKDHALRLTYTSHDVAPFARGLGHEGPPFKWDIAERRQLRARLDALYFHLYGLGEDDASYVLDRFPILRRNEERARGLYAYKDLVLGHHRALTAGDHTATIQEW